MSSFSKHDVARALATVRWPLALTRLGMTAEAMVQSLWPLMTVCLIALALLMLGLQDHVLIEVVWISAVISAVAFIATLIFAFKKFRLPSRAQAMARLDASMPGRPLRALLDTQAIGENDANSAAVWRAHKARMAARAASAVPVAGDLRVSDRDPYALRFVAVLAFGIALLFGSVWKVGSIGDMTPGNGALADGPIWEGWVESPRYTGRPTIYLGDIPDGVLQVPAGSLITLRLYGEVGALTVAETVSNRTSEIPAASSLAQDFTVVQDGSIAISGPGGRTWDVQLVPDTAPKIAVLSEPEATALGQMTLPFAASDDYGVEAGEARISLDLDSVARVHGMKVDPEQRPDLVVPLPTPIAGNRRDFEENLVEDFSEHAWANLPVKITLVALDAAEQQSATKPRMMTLPGRRFFDPMAAAIIEQRRDLLWSRANSKRISQILRAVSHLPQDAFRKQTDHLRLHKLTERLELFASYGVTDEQQDKLAADLWGLALILEEGDLADALERMRRAQDRLNEAMKNGASDAEIAELMQELRRATEEYLEKLSREAQRDQQEGEQDGERNSQNEMQMTQDDLQKMMDRIQELMEEGRMAEAQQALQELQELMENMRMSQSQQGQSPGEEAMEGLGETLREQQGLSDQAFRDLQEQFNPGAQAGESQGNEGRNGGQGRGQSHEGQSGQGADEGEERLDGSGSEQGGDQGQEGDIADRQQALRDELRRQQQNLPGAGTPEGDAARDALERAGRAMDGAEEALRQDDLAEAIDNQAQAMEALREGMRSLGEAMAKQQRENQPGQGTSESDRRAESQDPLGRDQGNSGAEAGNGPLALDDDAYGRARELLDEIRRRSGETVRPEIERDYLKRLLDRF